MIVPNTNRVLLKKVEIKETNTTVELTTGQMKVGENLFVGEIIHPGNTKFKEGQRVYYSEYSQANIMDLSAVERKDKKYLDALKEGLCIVAEDDIMAYEE